MITNGAIAGTPSTSTDKPNVKGFEFQIQRSGIWRRSVSQYKDENSSFRKCSYVNSLTSSKAAFIPSKLSEYAYFLRVDIQITNFSSNISILYTHLISSKMFFARESKVKQFQTTPGHSLSEMLLCAKAKAELRFQPFQRVSTGCTTRSSVLL